MRYQTAKLGDHVQILSGFAFKSKDFTDDGIPVIKIKNVTPPSVSLIDLSYIPEEIADKNKKFILSYDDVLIALTGSHINQMASVVGRVARVKYSKKTVLNQRVGKITAIDPDDCDIDFVYYYLSQDQIKIELASKAGGAANQANISPTDIKNLMIPFPEIGVQRKISAILRTYDDLIENNQKQIKLLEEAAQRLYKEWFVDLRFPGHETTPITDDIPEGWAEMSMEDICDSIGGGTPSTKNDEYYRDGKIKWVTPTDITRKNGLILLDTEKKITEEGLRHSSAKIVPPYTILMTSRASVGFFGLCKHEVCTNQGFISCVPYKENVRFFLLYNLMNRVNEIRGKASGSTFLEISKKNFRGLKVILPLDNILDAFNKLVHPMIQQMEKFTESIAVLQEARDRLLPKLMNGEIEV